MQSSGHRLSESPLWEWQRNYFARQGIRAWSAHVVPDFATNNAFTARCFAGLMRARILDYAERCGEGVPERVFILEAGAGSGRFAYRFLQFLHARELPCPVTYVLTDFTDAILDFWRRRPRLQALFRGGRLDMARYDAATNDPIRLEYSGRELSPGSLGSPLLVIGNYYFDSLPHDLFRVENGQLLEGRVTFSEPEGGGAGGLDAIHQTVNYVPVALPLYERADWNAVLRGYPEELKTGTFTFPSGGMRSLEFLAGLSRSGCFMLAADKGPNLLSGLESGRHEEIDKHGAVSVSVNFHALAKWVGARGGQAWQQAHPYHRLNIAAFQVGGAPAGFPATGAAFQAGIADFGPDDFANLKDEALSRREEIPATALFSFLRLSRWDPELVMSFYTRLARVLPGQSAPVKQAFADGFRKSWDLHYSLDEQVRFGFLLGGLCAAMGEYRDALRFYVASIREEGEAADVVFNAALCLARLGADAECRQWLAKARALGVAEEELDLVEAELG